MSFLGSIGSALGGIGSSLFDSWLGREARYSQAHLQDRYNMKYWNLQNEYNSPVAQMQRFREAGLNPNLIYGQTNMAGDVGSVSASASGSSSIMSNILGRAQVRNLMAQNDNIVQQNDNLKEQARALRIDNNLREKAGVFADAPWWARMIMRSLPSSLKNSDGTLKLPELTMADLKAMLFGSFFGLGAVFNPVHNLGSVVGSGINPENLPPSVSWMFNRGDRGSR